jgi:hypothetical protein
MPEVIVSPKIENRRIPRLVAGVQEIMPIVPDVRFPSEVGRTVSDGSKCMKNLVEHAELPIAGLVLIRSKRIGSARLRIFGQSLQEQSDDIPFEIRRMRSRSAVRIGDAIVVRSIDLIGGVESRSMKIFFDPISRAVSCASDLGKSVREAEECDVWGSLVGVDP